MRLSIVIPALNEAPRLRHRLRELAKTPGVQQVVVVDGGSEDDSWAVAESARRGLKDAGIELQLLSAPRGRARQMNAGADRTTGDVLLFQHADVALPRDAIHFVEEALRPPRVVGGAFWTWHVDDRVVYPAVQHVHGNAALCPAPDASPHSPEGVPGSVWWLHIADIRSTYTRLPYGDQCVFVRRSEFEAIGGYPEIELMEDLEFALRLSRRGELKTVPASVRVSGRRFLKAPLRYALLVNSYPYLYRLGVPARMLAEYWRQVR